MNKCHWNKKPRTISIVVDNPSWILPYAEKLAEVINSQNDNAIICSNHKQVKDGCIAYYIGCTNIVSSEILSRNKFNLVVHESELPKGKGFAPVAWQILEGKSEIPICLFEAVDEVDAGNIYYLDKMLFDGHELNSEIRDKQGNKTIELCLRFLNEPIPPASFAQNGESTFYKSRKPEDSMLDPEKSIGEQFNLLRIVDNKEYPAFFEKNGYRYKVMIEKVDALENKD